MAREREEIGCGWIVRAHPLQKEQRVGTLKFKGEVAFVEKCEDGGEDAGGDGVSDAGGVGEA